MCLLQSAFLSAIRNLQSAIISPVSSVVTVPLMDVVVSTPRSRLITLDLQGTGFTFLAGQAVTVGGHGQPLRRPYSIACSPERASEIAALELLIGLDASGAAGPHLSTLVPGSPIDVQGPLGAFTFPESLTHRRLLFVAGGNRDAPPPSVVHPGLPEKPPQQNSLR